MKLTNGTIVVLLTLVLCGIVVISGLWSMFLGRPGPLATPTTVVIESGSSLNRIANQLAKEQVIGSPLAFKLTVRALWLQGSLQAGGYEFEPGTSLKQVIGKLSTGDIAQLKVTIPEGFTTHEVITRLNSLQSMGGEALDAADYDEGTLLPETYAYTVGENRATVAARMKLAMEDAVAEAWLNRYQGLPYKTPEELVTMASIIEKETAIEAERTTVASVFVNRLMKDMKLEADPTVIYGASNYNGNITRAHLREDQPYNTYVHKGLPPGPIANPGRASLMAAGQPAATDYIFFVADGYGGHIFAKTYAEHAKNVENYVAKYRAQQQEQASE